MDAFLSDKFRFWSFVSMCLLVFVHGYNLEQSYLQPWTLPGERMTVTTFFEYWTANGLLRFRIPLLFLISGYLFAIGDAQPRGKRIGKRARSLLLPYLWWSALALLFLWAIAFSSVGKAALLSSRLAQIDEHRMLVSDYTWWEVLLRWLLAPVAYQLWFVRSLFVYNLMYPALRFLVLHRVWRWPFWVVAVLFWLSSFGMLIEGEGLVFFSLGIGLQKWKVDLQAKTGWMRPRPWLWLFLALSLFKTWLAFRPWFDGIETYLTLLHKAVVLAGLVAAWTSFDGLVRWSMQQRIFRWASSFSFMIYGLHTPLVVILFQVAQHYLSEWPGFRLGAYLIIPMAIIGLSLSVGWLLRAYWPWFYGQLTGGRGMKST